MPIPKSILKFLDKNKIKYEIIKHRIVYTAYDKAATLGLKPQQVAKTVIINLDNKDHALALIPANKNLDKKKFLKIVNAWKAKQVAADSHGRIRIARDRRTSARYSRADFAKEQWMKKVLRGIKLGATPPFGVLYKLPTFIDNALTNQPKLIVNAGDYQNSLKITPAALFKLDKTVTKGSFSQAKK